jgi:NADPH:quinone reductase-like Zn-dependent oxidoreductase
MYYAPATSPICNANLLSLKTPGTNRGVLGFNLIWLYERAELLHQLLQELDALQLSAPHVGHRFTFEQLPDAIRLFQTGKTVGKVVVEVL